MWKKTLFLFINLLFLLAVGDTIGQTTVSGTITDQQSNEKIPFVSVVIYQFQSNQIVDYAQSDQQGNFSLSIPRKKSVYTLKTSRLGYQKSEQSIVVASDAVKQLTVPIRLIQDTTNLKEVIIEGPIIVKEDTTIYDVAHFTTARSKSLEDVLSNIPGFKISPDGTIQVDGKVVDKVIVDGKEVSSAGGGVLTKALSPENVESVEVRFDEKDDKLKNSLLDSKKFVVLDIKLKEDLNKSLFGRAKLTSGYRNQPEYGGYSNLFSLTKTNNLQFFAEHDRFGFETIPLKSIKNIGADAYNLLFDLPADFQSLTEKEDFNNQVFGFSDYTRAEKSILGISNFIHFNDQWSLYIGSYSNLANDGQRRNYQQGFDNSVILNDLSEQLRQHTLSTKNKAELRFDKSNWKIRYDANYSYLNQSTTTNTNALVSGLFYEFENNGYSDEFVQNLLVENKISRKSGVKFAGSYSSIWKDTEKLLLHNDSTYMDLFIDNQANFVSDFRQDIDSKAKRAVAEVSFYHRSKLGNTNTGFRYLNNQLSEVRNGRNNRNGVAIQDFVSETASPFNFSKLTYFVNDRISFGKFDFFGELGTSSIRFPSVEDNERTFQLEFVTTLEYQMSKSSSALFLLKRQVGSFPLRKIVRGFELESFQTIAIPGTSQIQPTPEYVAEISGVTKFSGWEFDPAALYGRTFTGNRFVANTNGIVEALYDQLEASYWAITLPLKKRMKNLPLFMILEPEWIINSARNISEDGISYLTRTNRTLLGLKVASDFDHKKFNFNIFPKYTAFNFFNGLSEVKSRQEMFSLNMRLNLDFLEHRLLLSPQLRTVRFFGNVRSEFTNLAFSLSYRIKGLDLQLQADNLLNNQFFVRQTLFPNFFISENSEVFSRFVRLGVEFKID